MGMERLLTNGEFCGFFGLRNCTDLSARNPAGSLRGRVPDAAAQAPRTPDPHPVRTRTQRYPTLTMPYIDINPHKGRPRWVGYAVLAILVVLTAAVVSAALIHH